MCRYVKYTNTTSQLMYVAQEHSIYGSSRVGVDGRKDTLYKAGNYSPSWGGVGTSRRDLGSKSFELANHLGNVLVTVSDKPIYKVSSATIYFNPELTSSSDYYPFGAPINGRSAAFGSEYRFGFNGQEKDPEGMGGGGSTYDYGFRIYNAQIAKFLSVDPLTSSYPWYSPYQYAGNRPIDCIDLDGLERVNVSLFEAGKVGLPEIKKSEWYVVGGNVMWNSFASAASNNTPNNPGAYQNVEDRHNYYLWAHTEASKKGSNWFGAAAIVTQRNAVGAAGNLNLWFLNDGADKFLQEGNKFLFSHNMSNLSGIMNGNLDKTFVDANGSTVSLKGMKGKQLDYALVQFEQTKVQEFIDGYQKNNPDANMSDIMGSINSSMTSYFAPSEIYKVMEENFNTDNGQEAFDFSNYDHRVKLGQKLVDQFSKE